MSRFRKLSRSEKDQLYRYAQEEISDDHLVCPNSDCPTNVQVPPGVQPPPSLTRNDIVSKGAYGRYTYTCSICGWRDSSRAFFRPTLDGIDRGKGVPLSLDDPVIQRVVSPPRPSDRGIATIS
jgi:hypothetical protein